MEMELPDEKEEIDSSKPSSCEVRKAIGYLKIGKARGIDNVQAQLPKVVIEYVATSFKEIMDIVWRKE